MLGSHDNLKICTESQINIEQVWMDTDSNP